MPNPKDQESHSATGANTDTREGADGIDASSTQSSAPPPRWMLVLVCCAFFVLLGSRSLNEPDEGRYSVIAWTMASTGDWVVPKLWLNPHMDKPPFTYWAEAASLKVLGPNEWGVRVPLALAALSGILATLLLGRAILGRAQALWAIVVLGSSLLYFVMARMLTTDLYLTQFVAWAALGLWQTWASSDPRNTGSRRFLWGCLTWAATGGGVLTKGPIALAIPAASAVALLVAGRKDRSLCGRFVVANLVSFPLMPLVAAPWFLLVFNRLPGAADFMVFGQAVGHAMGRTANDRSGHPLYFFAILAVGFLPWTPFLGWLWRRDHWRGLSATQRQGWVFLNVWAIFTFTLFSLTRSKLPAYILPIFPALALLCSWRFFGSEYRSALPRAAWRTTMLLPALGMAALPLVVVILFKPGHRTLLLALGGGGLAILAGVLWMWRVTQPWLARHGAVVLAYANLIGFAAAVPTFETELKSNQTLKPIGEAIQAGFQPGARIVCWGRFPQGLPFYTAAALDPANPPYLGGMPTNKVPFEFTGNLKRFSPRLLESPEALEQLLKRPGRTFLVLGRNSVPGLASTVPSLPAKAALVCGLWELRIKD